VQIDDESSDPAVPSGDDAGTAVLEEVEAVARPVIQEIAVRTTGTEAEAEVSLSFGGNTFTGTATGSGAASQRPRLVAQATLIALTDLLGLPAHVESASVVDTGIKPVALVVLSVSVPRLGPQSLSGSAVIRGDEAEAVARAVLAALNRRLAG
jgi:hypothetical protein